MDEKQAEMEILNWCRSKPYGQGYPVMREHKEKCLVIDLSRTEQDPESKYSWERRDRRIATGDSWIEVHNEMKEKGLL